MATFSNQAQLSYDNKTVNSNTATGTLIETVSITHTAIAQTYAIGDKITFIISIVNSGTTAINNGTATLDLGEYELESMLYYALSYVPNSIRYFRNGVLVTTIQPSSTEPLVIPISNVPACGNVIIVYEATVTEVAPPNGNGFIENKVTLTAESINTSATATVRIANEPNLVINKSFSPTTVAENGQLSIIFVIQNYSGTPATIANEVVITDQLNPQLDNVSVTYNGIPWTQGNQFTYADGLFTTSADQITVPAATFTQDPATGAWNTVPGVATIVITGTV